MSDMIIKLKAGDLLPAVTATLTDGGEPVDLSDIGSLHFRMSAAGDGEPLYAEAEVLDDGTEELRGKVRYDWQEGDTDRSGVYRGDFVVISGGKPTSFPDDEYIVVVIHAAPSTSGGS